MRNKYAIRFCIKNENTVRVKHVKDVCVSLYLLRKVVIKKIADYKHNIKKRNHFLLHNYK